jgi:hypothetical protein
MCIYNAILFINARNPIICSNVDKPCFLKGSKTDKEKVPHDLTYICNPKIKKINKRKKKKRVE